MKKFLKIAAILVLLFSCVANAEGAIEEPPMIVEQEMAKELTCAPQVNISFHFSWSGNEVHYGDEIELVPEITGANDLIYWYEWQYSTDNSNWISWPNNSYTITKENVDWYWRLVVSYEWEDAE